MHMQEFDIALNTGMRKSEQYTLEWPEVSLTRKRIRLDKTKNGSEREIPMNKTCLAVATRGPILGICLSRWQAGSDEAICSISSFMPTICCSRSFHSLQRRLTRLRMRGVKFASVFSRMSGIATLSLNGVFAKVMPRSSRKARSWLITDVRRAMRRSRTRWMACKSSWSSVLIPQQHLARRAQCHEVKRILAKVNTNRMNLHVDDPP